MSRARIPPFTDYGGGRVKMSVSESDKARVIELLLLDVEATLGPGHEAAVRSNALRVASFGDDPVYYRDKLVEDVQQYFHDCFVDTTWPTCPRHSKHPLWLHDESWYCERDAEAIARLGALGSIWSRGMREKT
jgi:hypothetical protein